MIQRCDIGRTNWFSRSCPDLLRYDFNYFRTILAWLDTIESCSNLVQKSRSGPTGETSVDVLWRYLVTIPTRLLLSQNLDALYLL
jgi:hypothetical protein